MKQSRTDRARRRDARNRANGSTESAWPHRLSIVTAIATVPLLFAGALVTSKGAALAVPDWPTTFGYNMFFYPWAKMVGGVLYEHSHRLIAAGVGALTIVLALAFWFYERRSWLRWLGVAALALVIVQGVLGGLRVVLLEHDLAIVHACLAQAFFALVVSLASLTSPPPAYDAGAPVVEARLWRLGAVTTGLIYLQGVFGAVLRHTGERLDAHLLFAALVIVHVILLVRRVVRLHAGEPRLLRPAVALGSLSLIQLGLGVLSYFAKFAPTPKLPGAAVWATTTHLLVGALMLASAVVITLRAYRLSRRSAPVSGQPLWSEPYST
ncbi:MAG TPA: COX15/CtaA family protein [Candidatus Eisenbacteria bacterium]|nr:COX15/CtaA family protein [Candidatus Eisenbacteria bacterium]